MQRSRTISNKEFYNLIAPQYNDQLKSDPTNEIVRTKVSRYFNEHVPKGRVLDFGGGTGLDLPWLLDQGYQIVFCEPSCGMRLNAKEKIQSHPYKDKILFLNDDETNTENWKPGLPISEPVDACIANFAVLNCIHNISHVFEKLGEVIMPGGHFVCNVLDARFKFLISRYFKSYLKSIFQKEMITYSRHQNVEQEVYLHSLKKIEACARSYFNITHTFPLGGYGFTLLHLTRK